MSTHQRFGGSADTNRNQSYFEEQRAALLGDIGVSFEQVLANINKLNRSLEAVITVGNEFASVETLWSQFENVMAKDPKASNDQKEGDADGQGETNVKREE
ncbi:Putative DASH complex subunit Dad1 [[Torrubiella] hemipterigena]|uniref:DASH complex subunit DAD1 n=1 Tax=[Torrubiella] hemipterigena TaxID=1531966 RepID=A0A0A1TC09_9HYPO|nr:Putative DASH complex subunit Dad1 [[Torrubiella] hemipterigena]